MKLAKANAELLNPDGLHPYKFMERVGRICYKSEDKITDESAVKFIRALAKNRHTAMLEHAHIYAITDGDTLSDIENKLNIDANSIINSNITPIRTYLNITNENDVHIISGSFRAFITLFEDKHLSDDTCVLNLRNALSDRYPEVFNELTKNELDSIYDEPAITVYDRTEFKSYIETTYAKKPEYISNIFHKHLTHTILFTCDRGVTHEFVRHRPASFAQESTRYCNYNHDKFGREITVIEPPFWAEGCKPETHDAKAVDAFNAWYEGCKFAEKMYFMILEAGGTPQQARDVLPTSVKTEIAITATESEWQHIINLRLHGTTGAPHPQMIEVMAIAMPFLQAESNGRLK